MVVFGTFVMSGVTGRDGADSKPFPAGLVACTVNVYGVPLERPETTALPLLEPGAGAGTVVLIAVATPLMRAVTV
jgi:hypothetical protein